MGGRQHHLSGISDFWREGDRGFWRWFGFEMEFVSKGLGITWKTSLRWGSFLGEAEKAAGLVDDQGEEVGQHRHVAENKNGPFPAF